MRKNYTTISLPKELMETVDRIIKGKGYSSRAEYIKFLIRNDTTEVIS